MDNYEDIIKRMPLDDLYDVRALNCGVDIHKYAACSREIERREAKAAKYQQPGGAVCDYYAEAEVSPDTRDEYVVWLRFVRGPGDSKRIVVCDSDEVGAFKVYRRP